MLSDIEIAQAATLLPIKEVAAQIGIKEDELDFYGKYKAKLSDELAERLENEPDGKLILVTAINPTPAGEGKTTTSAGLGQAMAKIGKRLLSHSESLHSVLYSVLRAVLPAAVMLRYCLWRISTFILQVICTQLLQQTIFVALCLTTTFSRAMYSALTLVESSLRDVLI